jgi:CarboxypepD_reg-like domain/TonB-dependent Receptor Plug Domain
MKSLFTFIFLLTIPLFSQENNTTTISGFVFEEASLEALIGANIYLEDLPLGASTNNSGYYVITNVPVGKVKLVASFLGYKTKMLNIAVKRGENIKTNIVLNEDILESETIVVTADSVPIADQLFEKQISTLKLSARQINAIPQIAEADLLRSLQTLPGILPLSDFSSALYVRGGTPDQNLYLLDGTDVYNPEHAFGLFSTFNTDAIKQVDLSKGGFSADRGGRLSSIIDVTNIDGNRKAFEGKAGISLLSARTTLQTPLGNYGSLSGSLRRTYFDQTVGRAIDDIPDYYFYDGNIKAFFDLDANNNLTISGYGGRDLLDVIFNADANGDFGFKYDWGNKTGSLKWTHVFNPKLFSNFWVTASRFSSFLQFEGFDVEEENILNDITVKGNLEYHHANNLNTDFGFEQKNFDVSFKSLAPGREVIVGAKRQHYVAYLQTKWQPDRLWDVQAGIRLNYFVADKNFFDVAPRFALKYRLDDKSTLKFSTGIYHQYLHRIPRFAFADIWTTSNKVLKPSTSVHYIFGYQRELPGAFQFEAEVYYKTYKNIYSFDQNFLTELKADYFNEDNEPVFTSGAKLLNRGDGTSAGFEILLRKDSGIITGWVGYSFAETKYTIDDVNQERAFNPRHDRTHTVNVITNVDLDNLFSSTYGQDSSRWSMGMNFVYSTGQPITEPGSAYLIGSSPDAPYRDVALAPTRINQIRLPGYARMDLSFTWTRQYKSWLMAPYLQIYNIGNRRNVWFARYNFDKDFKPGVEEQYMFPLLPTIGINFEF